MSKIYMSSLIVLILFVGCKTKSDFNPQTALDFCATKAMSTTFPISDESELPRRIPEGKTNWENTNIWGWTSGFWPGILWYSYEYTNDESFRKEAERFTKSLKPIAYKKAKDHDIGFMIYCSYGNGYRLTKSKEYKKIMLSAADTLATLFNPNVGSINSWPFRKQYSHNTIIDNMMNLELLFWAAKNGGDQRLYDMAVSHANVTMKYIVRPDSAIFHVGHFNNISGEFLEGRTHQGYADSSMWARGQAWGIYGFAVCYRETEIEDYLETSVKLADHFLNRLPDDGIPFWDFDDPSIPNVPKDASAAAIAACGLLELSELVKDEDAKLKYKNAAVNLLEILSSEQYQSRGLNQAFLLHSTGNLPGNSEIDVPIIYADYYYMEALMRLKRIED